MVIQSGVGMGFSIDVVGFQVLLQCEIQSASVNEQIAAWHRGAALHEDLGC